jgi:internalin A
MSSATPSAVSTASPATGSLPRKIPWYVPTPTKLLALMLLVQVALFFSQHFHWFRFNWQKGFAVLFALVATSLFVILLLGWSVVGRFFGSKAQFSLASLLLLVPVMAIPCGWFAREYQQARQKRELTTAALSRGFRLTYAGRSPLNNSASNVSLPGGRFLLSALGQDFFDDLVGIDIFNTEDKDLELVASFPDLEYLRLFEARTSDAGMGRLRGLSRLRRFELMDRGHNLTDASTVHLAAILELEVLHLTNVRVTDSGLKNLASLPKLTDLQIETNGLTDQGLATLAATPAAKHIKEFDLANSQVTDAGMKHLKAFTEATHVNLSDTRVTDVGLGELAELHQLRDFRLWRTAVSDAGLEKLAGLKQLQRLDASHTKVGDKGLACLQTYAQLTILYLNDTPVNDECLANIADLKQLRELYLTHADVTDAGLEHIKKLTMLTTLDLYGTNVTDAGLECVGPLKGLVHVNLAFTQVTDEGLSSLLDKTNLQRLYVVKTRTTSEGVARFRKAMPKTMVWDQ